MLKMILASSNRYGLATMAPIVVSIAHFVLQMALLRVTDKSVFGLVALLLGFIQFGFGFSNALVSTPYTIQVNQDSEDDEGKLVYFKINALFAVVWGTCCAVLALGLGYADQAWMLGAFGVLAMVRWFGRAHLYALHRPSHAAVSDFVYAAALLVGIGIAWFSTLSLSLALLLLALASLLGTVAVGYEFLDLQFRRAWRASLKPYATIWKDQARWSLLGVMSSEATSNSHSYAVSMIDGPAAFAPIAAASLFVKPVLLVITSLTQLERPVIARQIYARDKGGTQRSVFVFRVVLIAAWSATIVGAIVVINLLPHLIFKSTYDLKIVMIAFTFMAFITLLQCWSAPASVLLQAADRFKLLGLLGMKSAAVAIVVVTIFAAFFPPAFSLFGILLGQIMTNFGISVVERQWFADFFGGFPEKAQDVI